MKTDTPECKIYSAEVIVPRAVKDTFSYSIPVSLKQEIKIGQWVTVPLGKSQVEALVIHLNTQDKPQIQLKDITQINTDLLLVSMQTIQLIQWFRNYYQCSYFCSLQTIVGKATQVKTLKPLKTIPLEKDVFSLSEDQQRVIKGIQNTAATCHYLCGVTGSGKTAVYVELAKSLIKQSKQVLIMVPEIALTQQLKAYFEGHFGEKVIVLHSGMTPAQKRNAKLGIAEKKFSVVIGPRSALFSPFKYLGLIILDEEHENSYKQDQHPRYLTHTVAEMLAKLWQADLIFASATPSLDSLSKIPEKQRWFLNKRINNAPLPKITLIDSLSESENSGRFFSNSSVQAIQEHLARKEKVLIFINRRGYAPYLSCQKCDAPLKCEGCGLNWTYHSDTKCRCHRCHLEIKRPRICSSCQKGYYQVKGLGTQRCDVICKTLFPQATVVRLDKDIAKTATQIQDQINTFKEKGDILIGTQMIAKGLHIEDITLVVFLGIDNLLNFPDFRAGERAYQLLVQVAGRAGRGQKKGTIIVESNQIEHPVLQQAIRYDFNGFTQRDLSSRERYFYPPYSQLLNILVSCPDLNRVKAYLEKLTLFIKSLEAKFGTQIKCYGPKACPIEKIRFHWRFHCLIKYPSVLDSSFKEALLAIPAAHKDIRVFLDIDPRNIL